MSRIFVIDNYDSFTYNLVQALGALGADVEVRRNDRATVDGIERLRPDRLLISPGPGRPEDAGISVEAVRKLAGKIPILGVCLGHQCVAVAFGAKVVRAGRIMHGKTSLVRHDGEGVLRGIPSPFEAMRYHSLAVEPDTLPDDLVAAARSDDGLLMGLRHRELPIEGVQFHPESYRTAVGTALLRNFLCERLTSPRICPK